MALHITHLKDLCVLQNTIIRIITGIPPRTNVDHLYIQQNILSVNLLNYYNIRIFVYKFSNSMLPEMFDSFFSRYALISYPSIFSKTYVNFRSKSRGQRPCTYSSAIIWNCILDNFDPECAIDLFFKKKTIPSTILELLKVDFFYMKFLLP